MSEEKKSDREQSTVKEPFTIYPAIDILGGKCVRLLRGDYNKVKVYSEEPLDIAYSFFKAKSKWIHIVDLDAAKSGIPTNHYKISEIVEKTGLRIQTGGGIRNMETLERVMDSGISRAVLGTGAVKDFDFVRKALERYGEKIAIGIDAVDGNVAVDGWTRKSGYTAVDFALKMKSLGAKTFIYTDIARDGMLSGSETERLGELIGETGANVISSGGVAGIEDVMRVKEEGASGVIIGKAIYEGKVDLEKCLQSV